MGIEQYYMKLAESVHTMISVQKSFNGKQLESRPTYWCSAGVKRSSIIKLKRSTAD